MTIPLRIDVETGCLLLKGARLMPRHDRGDAVAQIESFSPSFPFGHTKTAVLETNVGGERILLFLAFRDEELADATLSIGSDWLVGDDARRQVDRVNDVLLREHGIKIQDGVAKFPWGVVYSLVGRGGGAHFGVKYGSDALNTMLNML